MNLPEKFDLSSTEEYVLAFEVSNEMCSFLIYDPVEGESLFYHAIEKKMSEDTFFAFENFYYENEFLSSSYHKIFVVNNTAEFTFIPSDVFSEKKKDEFFSFNLLENEDKVLVQTLRKPEIILLHSISEKVFDFFSRTFLNVNFIHHLSPLISYFSERTRVGNTHKLIVNMQNKGLDVLYFTPSGEFVFANHFKYNHLNDVVYYIFFIWKQFNLNQLKDFIYVVGNSSLKSDLIKQIQKYVQYVFPVDITSSDFIPFELLSLTSCEL